MDRFVIRKRPNEESDDSRKLKLQKLDDDLDKTQKSEPLPISQSPEKIKKTNSDNYKQNQILKLSKIIERSESLTVWDHLALDPSKFDNIDNFRDEFDVIADKLLNGVELVIKGKPHRFCEIEFYLRGGVHQDMFTHADSQQLTCGQWYFHKNGNQFRKGNYKGLDLTFAKEGCHGGILIRSIQDLSDSKVYDGPCVCVNHILSILGCEDVVDLVQMDLFKWEANDEMSCLYVRPIDCLAHQVIVKGPRVGLSLKRSGGMRPSYFGLDYRYLRMPKLIKKGKPNMIIGLYKNGKGPADIHNITGTALATIHNYIELFENGKKQEPSQYAGMDLETSDLCKLLGACASLSQNKN